MENETKKTLMDVVPDLLFALADSLDEGKSKETALLGAMKAKLEALIARAINPIFALGGDSFHDEQLTADQLTRLRKAMADCYTTMAAILEEETHEH